MWVAMCSIAEVELVKGNDTQAGRVKEPLIYIQIQKIRNLNILHHVAMHPHHISRDYSRSLILSCARKTSVF